MAIFLDWFASHNTLVIQSLAGIVALLIVFLIFRLLFASSVEAEAAKNVTYAQLEEKLNKLLEQQSQMKASVAAASDVPAGDALSADALAALSGDPEAAANGGEQATELNRLRAEILTLKDSVNRKENEILEAKEQAQKSINSAQAETKLTALSSKLTEYEKEIDALKGRLSDYEIIAEDIADLQAFKKENQELKDQLANVVSVSKAIESEIEKPKDADSAQIITEAVAEPEITAEELEETLPADFIAAANSILDESIADSELAIETMPEASVSIDLDSDEAREVSKDVKKEDRILLDEFEKHFAKDED